MPEWVLACATITTFSAIGFAAVAVLWMRKMRDTVAHTLTEAANQQVRSAQRLSEAIAQLQKQQTHYEQQLGTLAQAGMRLRQELANVATRLEHSHADPARGDNTLH